MLKRYCTLFVNRSSGGYSEATVASIVDSLRRGGIEAQLVAPDSVHGTELAVQAACRATEAPLLLVAGGDGTVNTVLNGIEGTRATLGYIPLGTANVLAYELGIVSVETAINRIIRGDARECCTALVSWQDASRRFLLMAGVGFDGQVVHGVTSPLKRSLGKGAYVVAALESLIKWDHSEVRVVSGTETIDCHSVIFCNAARYGGNMVLAPDASLFTPGLSALCIQACTRFTWFTAAVRLVLGSTSGCRVVTGDRFEVQGVKPVQIDGDSADSSPCTVQAESGFFKIIT